MTGTVLKVQSTKDKAQINRNRCYHHTVDEKLQNLIRMFMRLALYTIALLFFLAYLNPRVSGDKSDKDEIVNLALGTNSVCPPLKESLHSIVETSSVIVAGRFRQRFGKTRLKIRDGHFTATDQKFNATVLVTTVYKNDTIVESLITIGTFFIPTDVFPDQPGCLDAFYKNAKYIFFLRKLGQSSNFFELTQNPQPFTEKLAYTIYAKRCATCFAPKIEPISNREVKHGERLTITCTASGQPLPELVWIKNGKSLNLVDKSVRVEQIKSSDERIESILEIANLIRIDSGEYKCLASNPLGEASVSFNLQVSQPEKPDQLLMDTELVECPEENRDYCLNGGQCYMLKADRNVLQCSCHTPFYGTHCERVAVDYDEYKPYAEAGDAGLHSMFKEISHEIITHLSWSIWGSFLMVVGMLLYLIYTQYQLKRFLHEKCRSRSITGNKHHSRSAQGSNLLLGSRTQSCTQLEDNNAITLPVPAGTRSSNMPPILPHPELNPNLPDRLIRGHMRDSMDPMMSHHGSILTGSTTCRTAWNQPATLGHKPAMTRNICDLADFTHTQQATPHMFANMVTRWEPATRDTTVRSQKNLLHIPDQSIFGSVMDVTRPPFMAQSVL